ncbi:HrpB1 family type III secretion system apparatus protein [Variovorax sp. 770b2]|uniref:HrpB1 family type III secretion system apparatus protein n=1 Tax=Variovorax sp. 770b2 TaxID=1566271 RepID=UPI0008F25445|nr:HrpB1 family type III secretion system apparatus protein [Variovorax sp. 770b2]SFQ04106.1 type III secretion protein (HrpB1_HrpK) [Variovorax sp. 770b2]
MKDAPASQRSPEGTVPGTVYRSLLQIAALGSELGEYLAASQIAGVLQGLRPGLPQAGIVRAMNTFCGGDTGAGIAEFGEVLAQFPDSHLAKALLAVCMKIDNRAGWPQMLEAVIDDGRDNYAVGLACTILGRSQVVDERPYEQAIGALPAHVMWA